MKKRLCHNSLLILALVMASGVSGTVLAQERPEAQAQRLRVMVLEGRDFRIDAESLFYPGGKSPVIPDDAVRIADEAAVVLASETELEVLRPSDSAPSRDASGTPELVVRGLLHLGLERYRDIRIPAAIQILEQGVQAASQDYLDLFAPDLVSDLYLYLGLSYLEQGSAALAHVAFKNMFFSTPGRRFRKGYFTNETEAAIRAAAIDFLRTHPKETVLGSVERTVGFLERTGAKAVVHVFATGMPGLGDRIELRLIERNPKAGGGISMGTMTGFPFTDQASAFEQVSRSLTAWHSCADLPSRRVAETRLPRFFMDTSSAYALFMKVPTRKLFHNAGFGVGLSWQVQEGLDIFGRLNLFNSFPDPYGDLVRDFWSIRGIAGVGYSMRGLWGRVFVHTGLDVNYLSGFESTTDPACKFWPDDPERCQSSRVKRPSYLVGLNVSVGVNIAMAGPISLLVQAGVSSYFFSNETTPLLNFPFSLDLGLGYAFF